MAWRIKWKSKWEMKRKLRLVSLNIPLYIYMEVSLNSSSQNGGNSYWAPYYNSNLNIGPRIDSNLGQSPDM